MKSSVSQKPLAACKADAWVLFVRASQRGAVPVFPPGLPEETRKQVGAWIRGRAFTGRCNETAVLATWRKKPAHLVLAGIGDEHPVPAWRLDHAAAAALRTLGPEAGAVAFSLAGADGLPDGETAARAVARGAVGGAYVFRAMKSPDTSGKKNRGVSLVFAEAAPRAARGAREGIVEGEAIQRARDLANLPGNEATPVVIAARARAMARSCGLSYTVLDRRALERERCNALLAVGQGSQNEPRMIILKHAGRNPKARPVVLVGKTLTFDAGGICLKPSKGMEWMRYDKCGGMAVLAAMEAAARLDLPCPVVGILAAAENLPGGRAARPGDIVRARSGKTVEIINTDAEGRLVLADALAYAAVFNPRAVVDLATLTGAVIVALGHEAAGVLGTDDTLCAALRDAGEQSGDRLWPLPLWPEYDEGLKSKFADIRNINDGGAGTIAGAAFLKAFVPEGVPWAHVDIAGTAWLESDKPRAAAGATLFGARLLTDWLRTLKP